MKYFFLILIFSCLKNEYSYSKTLTSFEKDEITIVFSSSLENLFKEDNGKTLTFKLLAHFSKEDLNAWVKSVKSDQAVKSISVGDGNIETGWDVKVILKQPINRSIAKTLFSFSLKTDYIMVGEENFLFNVFISQHVPN